MLGLKRGIEKCDIKHFDHIESNVCLCLFLPLQVPTLSKGKYNSMRRNEMSTTLPFATIFR